MTTSRRHLSPPPRMAKISNAKFTWWSGTSWSLTNQETSSRAKNAGRTSESKNHVSFCTEFVQPFHNTVDHHSYFPSDNPFASQHGILRWSNPRISIVPTGKFNRNSVLQLTKCWHQTKSQGYMGKRLSYPLLLENQDWPSDSHD